VSSGDRKVGHDSGHGGKNRHDALPRRLSEVIAPALDRLAGGDEARAYSAWAQAVGEPVSGGTRPRAFRRGQLVIECASSVWANELTYLGPQILRRMDEVAPGHPVERFRFIVGRLPAHAPGPSGGSGSPAAETGPSAAAGRDAGGTGARLSGQGSEPSAAKEKRRQREPAPDSADGARASAKGVRDERLRTAIEAALRPSSEGSSEAPGRGTSAG
jgi:hypothetical protein